MNSNIPVNLGRPSLRARLEAYYSLICPGVLSSQTEWRSKFEQIYEKYGGSSEGEKRLASKLEKKYGTAIRLLVAESTSGLTNESKSAATAAAQPKESDAHDEDWFLLRSCETNTGVLRFVSERFDPVAAQCATETEVTNRNPWLSECPLLDTVAQFAFYLPNGDPLRKDPVNFSKRRASDAAPAPKKKKRELHPFEAIASSFGKGPMSVLQACHRQRVRVIVRYVNAIRGTLTGTLLAFDKHMNMILKEVDEIYSPRPLDGDSKSNVQIEEDRRLLVSGVRIGGPPQSWAVGHRKMKQIMVRGDNVVAIYKADIERQEITM